MRWTDDRGGNVDDRRGSGGGGGGMIVGGGLGTLIIAAIVFFLGGDPSGILNSGSLQSADNSGERRELTVQEQKIGEMVKMMAAWNTQTWTQIFRKTG
jgi:predicted metalloprotease